MGRTPFMHLSCSRCSLLLNLLTNTYDLPYAVTYSMVSSVLEGVRLPAQIYLSGRFFYVGRERNFQRRHSLTRKRYSQNGKRNRNREMV